MAAEFEIVDIWVGNFADEEAFQAYVEEQYDEEDEDAPISAFARDLNQSFYDHDLVESKFLVGAKRFEELCEGLSFLDSYFAPAKAAYASLGSPVANVVLLAFGETVEEPKTIEGEGYRLSYLGRFACEPKSFVTYGSDWDRVAATAFRRRPPPSFLLAGWFA